MGRYTLLFVLLSISLQCGLDAAPTAPTSTSPVSKLKASISEKYLRIHKEFLSQSKPGVAKATSGASAVTPDASSETDGETITIGRDPTAVSVSNATAHTGPDGNSASADTTGNGSTNGFGVTVTKEKTTTVVDDVEERTYEASITPTGGKTHEIKVTLPPRKVHKPASETLPAPSPSSCEPEPSC